MSATAAAPGRILRSLRAHDPDLAGVRRATRAVVVITPLFAIADLIVRNPQLTIFTVFGCFALLVMADFGGMRKPRAAAYLTTVAVGAVLVAVGTLASAQPWIAAAAMLVVGFAIQFSTVFGGYAPAAQMALMLSFVLAVAVPAPPEAIPDRLEGWLLAGVACTLGGVFLWPRFEQVRLRREAATGVRALADLVEAERRGAPDAEAAGRRRAQLDAARAAHDSYRRTPRRPTGPTRRDRAFSELVTELERAAELGHRSVGRAGDEVEPGDGLGRAVVETLRAAAGVLEGGPQPDLVALAAAGSRHREALRRWAVDAMRADRSSEDILAALQADHQLRIISYLTMALATNAVIAGGGRVTEDIVLPAGTPVLSGPTGIARRVARTVRTQLHPDSAVLRASVRTGIGLGLAVLLARLLNLQHGFWVVLGTISVLRTTAVATGRTTLQALGGTVAGFVIAGAIVLLLGSNLAMLWALLPICLFLAAYVQTAIGFVAGQAAFTVNVIVLFNLIAPAGWQVGLARVEDVAVGTAVSVVVGALLWPRGARAELRTAVGTLYRAAAAYLGAALERSIAGGSRAAAESARRRAVRARDRAGGVYSQYLGERAGPMDVGTAARLVASGKHAILLADLIQTFGGSEPIAAGLPEEARALRAQAEDATRRLRMLGDRLHGGAADGPAPVPSSAALQRVELRAVERWRTTPSVWPAAVAVEGIGDDVRLLDELCAALDEPVTAAAGAARVPWWR